MTISRSEDLLVGLFALTLVPLVGLRIVRGLRDGRMPLYRTYLSRDQNRAKFNALLVVHTLSFALVAAVAADLLLNLGFREAL